MASRSLVGKLRSLNAAVTLPYTRIPIRQSRYTQHGPCAAVETVHPAAVDEELRTEKVAENLAETSEVVTDRKGRQSRNSFRRKGAKKPVDGKNVGESSSQQPESLNRGLIKERARLLLSGEAVGLTLNSTPADIAAGFKGLRPLAKTLRAQSQTLLFFPSARRVKPEQLEVQSAEPLDDSQQDLQQQQQQKEEQSKQQQGKTAAPRVLELALVAVPFFQKPDPEVTIRVGAKSKPDVIARMLTRALLRSSSVAVRAAGPSAALVALQAAAQSRRAIGAEQQLDLAFSIEYLRLPANEASKPVASEEQTAEPTAVSISTVSDDSSSTSASTSGEAAANATASSTDSTPASISQGFVPKTSVLQFSFYKRSLPTPEVLVSDFAATRSGPAMAQLLTSLISERREVDVLLDSRDALFAMQTLSRVLRDSWTENKASVAVFLTSLEYQSEELSDADGSVAESNNVRYTARLQLRRIAGAPNLISTGDWRTLLGAAAGTVKWDSPIQGLARAMGREWYSAGIFSVWPQEGVCVARALRALWQAQQERAAAAAAAVAAAAASATAEKATTSGTDAEAGSSTDTVDLTAPCSPLFQIAVVPELQEEGLGPFEPRTARPQEGEGTRSSDQARQLPRATVLHLLEVSPMLASTLRSKEGRVVPISGGEQLHQLIKAVVLRNRMYGSKQGGKLLALRPLLDDGGTLAMRFHYIDNSRFVDIPAPPGEGRELTQPVVRRRRQQQPPPQQQQPPPEAPAAGDGYATDDEFGVGAEAAVLVPAATAGAAAEAAAATTGVGNKSPWIMFVTENTSSMRLAFAIVAETCKPYDRLCPIWLRVRVLADTLATAALSVAMAQAQVQERSNVELLVVPVLERKRDEQNRPFNALTWQLIKYGPGAEPGAAAAAARGLAQPRTGPSQAAMAAAAAAAAKVQAQGDALLTGTRKLW